MASAINNAISRVGSPLVNALIFVAVAASFYATIGQQVPGIDTGSRELRNAVAPLNQPSQEVSPEVRAAAQQASTEAFHLAMLVAVGLLMAGAAVNGFGIRNPAPAGRHLEQAPSTHRPSLGRGPPAVQYRLEPGSSTSSNRGPIEPVPPTDVSTRRTARGDGDGLVGPDRRYPLELDQTEVERYRTMAEAARQAESDLWEPAGIVAGARVADVGCGPGAMPALSEVVGPQGQVVAVDADPGRSPPPRPWPPPTASATSPSSRAGPRRPAWRPGRWRW